MANYPLSFDNFTNPTSVDSLNSPSHSLQHADANDAIEALEIKLGIGNSPAGSATAGRVLVAGTGGTTSWTTVSAGAISTTGGTAGQYLSAGTAGVATWASVPDAGLTQIVPTSIVKGASGTASVTTGGAVTFSGTESISLNGVFTSTYDNYRIMCVVRGTTDANLLMRLRASGTDNTTTNYQSASIRVASNSTTVDAPLTANAGSAFEVVVIAANDCLVALDITAPQLAANTRMSGVHGSVKAAVSTNAVLAGGYNFGTNTQFDGFTIYPSTSTIIGNIRVYGYKNG